MIRGTIAIVGRPNVGKSTLFNALTRTRKALVDDQPGLTRDRIYGTVYFDDLDERGALVIDTGGFETKDHYFQPFKDNVVWEQTTVAIEESDLVVFVLDAQSGVHPHDYELMRLLATKNKPVVFVVNKIDHENHRTSAYEFYALGMDHLFQISAAHRQGLDELLEKIDATIQDMQSKKQSQIDPKKLGVRIALVGRPNAGKSSLLNRLIGEERSIVSEVAGTTRDSIDSSLTFNQKPYTLVDTAGIRRRSKIDDKAESLSVMRSIQSIESSDVVILVLDATATLTDQDARIASLAASQHKALIIVVNKWDLVPEKTQDSALNYTNYLRNRLSLMSWIPVLYVSCLENQRVHQIMQLVETTWANYSKRVETRKANDILRRLVDEHTPALIKATSKRVKFYYMTQVRTAPPTFVVFCNVASEIQESYKRYLLNGLRDGLDLHDVPIRLIYRGKIQRSVQDRIAAKNAAAASSIDKPVKSNGFEEPDFVQEMAEQFEF